MAWPGLFLVREDVTDIGGHTFTLLLSDLISWDPLEIKQGTYTGLCRQQEGPWLGLPDVGVAWRSHLYMQVSLGCALVV